MSKADALAKFIKLLEDEIRYDTYDVEEDDIVREKPEIEEIIERAKASSPDDMGIQTVIMSFIIQYHVRQRKVLFDNDIFPEAVRSYQDHARHLAGELEKILKELNPEITKARIKQEIRDFWISEQYDNEGCHDDSSDDDDYALLETSEE